MQGCYDPQHNDIKHKTFSITINKIDTQHNVSVVTLSVCLVLFMLSLVMLNAVMLNVVILNVVMLSVIALIKERS